MTTFRGRLTLVLAVSTAAFLSIFCLVLYFWCRSAFLSDLDGDLLAIMEAEYAASETLEGHLQGRPSEASEEKFEVFGLMVETDGTIVKSTVSGPDRGPRLTPDILAKMVSSGPYLTDIQYHGDSFRALGSPVRLDGRTLVEVQAISTGPVEESLEDLRKVLGLSLLVGIALLALISNRVARYLTQPLDRILKQLETVTSQGDPSLRLVGSYQDREMSSLQFQINAMLERLDRGFQEQRRFVSDASHELRSPLSNLSLALEVCLRREREPADYREVLETCRGETNRLTEMANSLLVLSKSDEGGLVVHRAPCDLARLLEECAERYRARAEQNGVEFDVQSEKVFAPVHASKLAQVLDNLVDNALRYAPRGSKIELGLSASSDWAEFNVTDHGPGVTSEERQHLFQRFYRADASRQRGTGGAGLGLAIARVIVEAHGGMISLTSEPGNTRFFLRIPLESTSG